jgi:hypothetical protein
VEAEVATLPRVALVVAVFAFQSLSGFTRKTAHLPLAGLLANLVIADKPAKWIPVAIGVSGGNRRAHKIRLWEGP